MEALLEILNLKNKSNPEFLELRIAAVVAPDEQVLKSSRTVVDSSPKMVFPEARASLLGMSNALVLLFTPRRCR